VFMTGWLRRWCNRMRCSSESWNRRPVLQVRYEVAERAIDAVQSENQASNGNGFLNSWQTQPVNFLTDAIEFARVVNLPRLLEAVDCVDSMWRRFLTRQQCRCWRRDIPSLRVPGRRASIQRIRQGLSSRRLVLRVRGCAAIASVSNRRTWSLPWVARREPCPRKEKDLSLGQPRSAFE